MMGKKTAVAAVAPVDRERGLAATMPADRMPLSLGPGAAIARGRMVAVATPESAPIERLIQMAGKEGRLIDLTFGGRMRAVVVMDTGHLIIVALTPEALIGRWRGDEE